MQKHSVLPQAQQSTGDDGSSPHHISRDPDDTHLLENGQNDSNALSREITSLRSMGIDGPEKVDFAVGVMPREGCCGPATVAEQHTQVF